MTPPTPPVRPAAVGAGQRAGFVEEDAADLVAIFEGLPVRQRRQALRQAIRKRDPFAPALVALSWGEDPELAATAAIGAARLGLAAEAGTLQGRAPRADALPRRERELFLAVRRAALATLGGQRPGPEDSTRNRLWRAILGEGGADSIAMAVEALIEPAPYPVPEATLPGTSVAMRRVEAVPHWLGHDLGGGVPNPVRRWTPPAPFLISASPLAADEIAALGIRVGEEVPQDAIDPILRGLSKRAGRLLALPLADEWEAALRGPDGRPRPWGLDARPAPGGEASPWGVRPGRPCQGEWTRGEAGHVVCGTDPSALAACRAAPAHGARLRLRVVLRDAD